MPLAFFDIKDIVHFEFIPQGQTVNQAYYVEILKCYVKLCIEKGLSFGPVIRFSTITMLWLTWHSLSSTFWPKNQLLKWNSPSSPDCLQITSGLFQT